MSQTSSRKSALFWRSEGPIQKSWPTIIFIHAAWMSSDMWDDTLQALEPQFSDTNLVRVDMNGHGKTNGRNIYSLYDQAEDLISLMDELEIPNAILVAISMGTMIAMRLALVRPDKVSGLILMSAKADPYPEAAQAALQEVRNVWVSTKTPSEEIMNQAILAWGGSPDLEGPRAKQIKKDWMERHSGAENIDPTLDSVNSQDNILGRLDRLRMPVLLIHGGDDQTFPVQDAIKIQKNLGGDDVEMKVIEGAGHLIVHMRDSEDVAQDISVFSKKVLGK